MLRKAILVCVVLAIAVNLDVAAGTREELLEKYEQRLSWGGFLMFIGGPMAVVGFLGTVGAAWEGTEGEFYGWAAATIGGAVAFVTGLSWSISSASTIRRLEKQKGDNVSLEVHGPSTAGGDSLGDISIVFRY